MTLKDIDWSEKKFTANGAEYFIEKEMSIQRSVFAEACKIELETGLRMGKQLEDWTKVYELANQQKFADIVVLAYNNRRGFKNFYDEHHPILKLCACFLNEKDEDRRIINDTMIEKKINDWAEEGYTMNSFFVLALGFLKIEVEDYKNATQAILDLIKEFNEKVSQGVLNTPILKS